MHKLATSILVLACATAANADPKPTAKATVKEHMERAAKAHKEGKFDVALTELEAAYELEPQPKLVYAIAQVYAKLDRCSEAITHYEQFIAETEDKSQHSIAKQAIAACKQKLEASAAAVDTKPETEPKPVEPTPPQPVDEPKPAPPPVKVEPQPAPIVTHSPWYTDMLGDALVIVGVAAGVGSVFTYQAAQSDLDAAESAPTLDGYKDLVDSAERKHLYTLVLAGGGAALVIGGVLRYTLRDSRRESSGVALVPTRDGGLITWSGGF
jgi:tetratricopeptide (TPR) repeat protein